MLSANSPRPNLLLLRHYWACTQQTSCLATATTIRRVRRRRGGDTLFPLANMTRTRYQLCSPISSAPPPSSASSSSSSSSSSSQYPGQQLRRSPRRLVVSDSTLSLKPQLQQQWTAQSLSNGARASSSSSTTTTTTTTATGDNSSSVKEANNSLPELVPYQRPTKGVLSILPASWVPYAELARLDKPAGTIYLWFPCLFSSVMASNYIGAPPAAILSTSLLFGVGAFIMRGAGCTINDLWDRNLDPHVARTRLRPLARRAITPRTAVIFAGLQCLAGLSVLLQLPRSVFYLGTSSLVLVVLYPLAKRVTHYPQFVLGLAFSWGALMGFPALGINLLNDPIAAQAAALLYASCVSWTVLYDMIYAHMDLKYDRQVGIKSIALRYEGNTKQVLTGLAAVQITLLAASGLTLGLGPAFYAGSCGGSLATLLWMIRRVKLEDASDCWWWFKYGAWLTGGTLSSGLLLDYTLS